MKKKVEEFPEPIKIRLSPKNLFEGSYIEPGDYYLLMKNTTGCFDLLTYEQLIADYDFEQDG